MFTKAKTQQQEIIERADKGLQAVRFLMEKYGTNEITMHMTGSGKKVTVKLEDA